MNPRCKCRWFDPADCYLDNKYHIIIPAVDPKKETRSNIMHRSCGLPVMPSKLHSTAHKLSLEERRALWLPTVYSTPSLYSVVR